MGRRSLPGFNIRWTSPCKNNVFLGPRLAFTRSQTMAFYVRRDRERQEVRLPIGHQNFFRHLALKQLFRYSVLGDDHGP